MMNANLGLRFRTTWDIIAAVEKGLLPDKIMLNTHPQRWDDRFGRGCAPVNPCSAGCLRHVSRGEELVWQNVKNGVKYVLVRGKR